MFPLRRNSEGFDYTQRGNEDVNLEIENTVTWSPEAQRSEESILRLTHWMN